MSNPFPPIEIEQDKKGDQDFNPAIRAFGRRFFADQSISEILLEFLLVATSPKTFGTNKYTDEVFFPRIEDLNKWPESHPLRYSANARLNLKLFSFLGASKLDTRHESHREHYRDLISEMVRDKHLRVSESTSADEIPKTLESLFLGFQSVGGQRTWCAQAFLPLAKNMLASETIWNETQARRDGVSSWDDVLERFTRFFSYDQHRFLARGGELLYLQICNSLRQPPVILQEWFSSVDSFSTYDMNPSSLRESVEQGVHAIFSATPAAINRLAAFIDTGVDNETMQKTDLSKGIPRFSTCGWCPSESWKEGTLFAIELTRICSAVIDPIDRIELLEIGCAMQLLRSLCAQSARHTRLKKGVAEGSGPLGYVWAVSDPAGEHNAIKQISRRNVKSVQGIIHDAIRIPEIFDTYSESDRAKAYKEADLRYGHKLYLRIAKALGLIVPRQGSGARFVLNDRLLRYLVLSLIRPGDRVTYDTFKQLMFDHHGIAVDEYRIGPACAWSGTSQLTTLGGNVDRWLIEMLEASGMLIRLSDSCSLVENPFEAGERIS